MRSFLRVIMIMSLAVLPGALHSPSFALQTAPEETQPTPLYQERQSKPLPDLLMKELIKKSEEYEQYALRFICSEMVRDVVYDMEKGEATKEKHETYEYLLASNPAQGIPLPFRQKEMGTGQQAERKEVKLEYSFPEAYSWIFIFSKNFRNVMKYGYIGKEVYDYKLAHIITFRGFQPFSNGKDIREWEGTIWVEEKTFNILKVEAEPIHQKDVLEVKRQEYNTAFSLIGIRLKKKPLGYSTIVYFDFENEGMTFPTEARNSTFELVAKNTKAPVTALIFDYADYHFFKTESKEKVNPQQ